ncbi:MAG: M20/M25/M40 family metallo-hydrolase [Gemmatimonadota bacterium]
MHADPLSRESVLELLQQLVRIPSVNPSLAPMEGTGERAIAEFARDWLIARAVKAWIDDIAPGRCNAVAEIGNGSGPALVACGHLDTVHVSGMAIPPFEPRVEGARLYGRGSYDMKGGVAAIMTAAAALAQRNLAGKFMVALVADEEYGSLGAQDFVRRYQADACVVTEPTENGMQELVTAHKGFVWLEVVTRGRAAHGSRWNEGVSAIAKMGPIIAALDEFDRNVLRKREHPLIGAASLHAGVVSGGVGFSTYAAECSLKVERRSLPGETPEQVLAEVCELAGPDAEVSIVLAQPPLHVSADSRIAQCARAALQQVTGKDPTISGVWYWMDAALFAQAGMDTVNFGASGEGAHAAVEWVDVDTVVQSARALYETGVMFCR